MSTLLNDIKQFEVKDDEKQKITDRFLLNHYDEFLDS